MNDELKPSEREAFEALPHERLAPRALEERVVGALRREGLVREPGTTRAPWWSMRLGFAPALAAGLLLFAGGALVGVRLAPVLAARVSAPDARGSGAAGDRAQRLEQSGADYLSALTAISRSADSVRTPENDRARASASRIMRQVAREMARLDPNDPLAAAALSGGPVARAQSTAVVAADAEATHIVWY